MNLDEFIDAIFVRFPPDNINAYHTLEDAYGEYRLALQSSAEYDYIKALNSVIAAYEYKAAPSPNYLKGHLNSCIIHKPRRYAHFPSIWADKNGYSYEFGMEFSEEQTRRDLTAMGFTNIRNYR